MKEREKGLRKEASSPAATTADWTFSLIELLGLISRKIVPLLAAAAAGVAIGALFWSLLQPTYTSEIALAPQSQDSGSLAEPAPMNEALANLFANGTLAQTFADSFFKALETEAHSHEPTATEAGNALSFFTKRYGPQFTNGMASDLAGPLSAHLRGNSIYRQIDAPFVVRAGPAQTYRVVFSAPEPNLAGPIARASALALAEVVSLYNATEHRSRLSYTMYRVDSAKRNYAILEDQLRVEELADARSTSLIEAQIVKIKGELDAASKLPKRNHQDKFSDDDGGLELSELQFDLDRRHFQDDLKAFARRLTILAQDGRLSTGEVEAMLRRLSDLSFDVNTNLSRVDTMRESLRAARDSVSQAMVQAVTFFDVKNFALPRPEFNQVLMQGQVQLGKIDVRTPALTHSLLLGGFLAMFVCLLSVSLLPFRVGLRSRKKA